MDQIDFGLFVLRLCLGLFLAYHGYNKIFGGGGLKGTEGWFGSIGLKWPYWQARAAAGTEIGAGLLMAAGLFTPLAAAGMVGVMSVAIWVAHRKVGFFVFLPNQGWEYCATIIVGALAVAAIGPGEWSLDQALGIEFLGIGASGYSSGWGAFLLAAILGFGGAAAQLAASYRPAPASS